MRLILAAVGKLKDVEERGICERYAKRLAVSGRGIGLGPLDIIELIESRAEAVDVRKADEASRLAKAAGPAAVRIALDENGKTLTSDAFARMLSKHADSGTKCCAFLIGGPDGHGADVLANAQLRLSLGAMTLPHGLARIVLIEQLYRAATILSGHPYHRV